MGMFKKRVVLLLPLERRKWLVVLERESGIGGFRERKIGKGEESQKIE